jgi:hypothetical protein
MKKSNAHLFNTPFGIVLIFILMAFIFAVFRDSIAKVNRVLLYMTREVKPPKKKDRKVVLIQRSIQQAKQAKKLIKSSRKSLKRKKKKRKLHSGREEPPREGFYLTGKTKPDNDSKFFITREKQVTYNPRNWHGKRDCAAFGWIRKTREGLVVTVEVVDDDLKADSKTPWKNDSVEFYFDLRPSPKRGTDKYEKGVFQAIAVPGFATHGADKVTFYAGGGRKIPVPGTKMKSWHSKGKYGVSVLFPFEGLRKNHFIPEDEFHLDIGINDSDSDGRSQLMWSGTSDNCRGPKFFGRMKKYEK